MQGLQLGKGVVQAIVGAVLDIVPPMIPPPVSVGLKFKFNHVSWGTLSRSSVPTGKAVPGWK